MTYKPEKLPVDKDTHKLLDYDSLYYVPQSPYNDYEFLKKISKLKKKFRYL